jgi:hypothetical protein
MSAAAFSFYTAASGGGFGIHDRTAVLLACHGFTALAYDWCGSHERPVEGLPSKVVDIPIEGPVKALRWLQRPRLTAAAFTLRAGQRASLIFRGVAFEFREHSRPRLWDFAFGMGK